MASSRKTKPRQPSLKGKTPAVKTQRKGALVAVPVQAAVPYQWEFFICLFLAWCAVMAGLFSLPNYNWLLPAANPFRQLPTSGFLWGGFLAMVGLWWFVPAIEENQWDFSRLTARIWFWGFLGLGAYLRLHHPEQPVGGFWDDHYIVISDIRNILDYHQRPLLFPSGWREPLFPYFTALLWALLPGADGVFIDKLGSTCVDLATFWVLYLAGKEIGGRRMGLVIMGMAAMCKGLICPCIFGYGITTTLLGCSLVFLFFLRLLKKPDLKHFLEWGAAMGVGGYVYAPYRPWTPVFLGIVWLWVFADVKERRFNLPRLVLGPGLLAAWAFLFIYKNSFLPENNGLINFLVGPLGLTAVGLLLGFSWVKTLIEERGKGFSKLFGWASGALLTALMMLPLFLHPHYSSHTSDISVFSKYYAKTPAEGWAQFWYNISFSVGLMYGRVNDVAQCPLLGDCVFDFWVPACGLLGLSYFVTCLLQDLYRFVDSRLKGRPASPAGIRWVPAFIVLLYGVGLVPFILSHGPHSFRLMAVYVPLFLTGAWGVSRLWLALLQTGYRKLGGALFALFLLAFMGWEIDRNSWLLKQWLAHLEPNAFVADQANKELPDHRVYLVNYQPGFFTCGEDILCDGKDIFTMNDTNPIDLLPEEKGKDLAILVYGPDTADQKKIEEAFPGLTWQKRFIFWQGPTENPFLWWAEIPFDKIPQGDKGLFHVQRVSPWTWERRCYGQYGLGRGLVIYNDRVTRWNDNPPPPNKVDWNNSMRVKGKWNITNPGDYALSIRTGNILWFFLDGKKILEVVPGGGGNRSTKVHLGAGPHEVELVTAFTSEHRVPVVYVVPPGSAAETPLDDLAAASAPVSAP